MYLGRKTEPNRARRHTSAVLVGGMGGEWRSKQCRIMLQQSESDPQRYLDDIPYSITEDRLRQRMGYRDRMAAPYCTRTDTGWFEGCIHGA